MSDPIDTGWSGTPDAIQAAVQSYGYQIANGYVALIDPTKSGSVVAMTGYVLLDDTAYVRVRSSDAVPLQAGVTAVGPEHLAALSGVFMDDGTAKPTTLQYAEYDARWLKAEKDDLATVAYRLDPVRIANVPLALSLALLQGIALAGGNGEIDLTSPAMIAWMGACVMAGVLTQARHDVILTP